MQITKSLQNGLSQLSAVRVNTEASSQKAAILSQLIEQDGLIIVPKKHATSLTLNDEQFWKQEIMKADIQNLCYRGMGTLWSSPLSPCVPISPSFIVHDLHVLLELSQ